MTKRLRYLLFAAGGFLLPAAGLFIWWLLVPGFAGDPLAELKNQTPVRVYLDRNGEEVYLERTYDAQWRFHTPLSGIPDSVIRVILAAEDADFFQHSGVDYPAVLRAFRQNLFHSRIVSGASTITMQLASMTDPDRSRTIFRKLRQMIRARRIEQLYSKEQILEEYLNRIPFGGKIYGIEAAARYYYGIHAENLTIPETALLCGLPQRPNYYRPDRHPERAIKRQKRVLQMLARRGIITEEQAEEYGKSYLRLRDFRYPADFFLLGTPSEDIFYFRAACREAEGAYRIHTAFDPAMSRLLHTTLRTFCEKDGTYHDAAAVIINNKTGETMAVAGTLDYHSPRAGQVNCAFATRTAGSVLKPFIYREGIRAGFLCGETVLDDSPLRYESYMPGNADGTFSGKITAADALMRSLNTPAIRLLARLGPERMVRVFADHGLTIKKKETAERTGLSLALGTAGHTLYNITRAYTSFTGPMCTGTFLAASEQPERKPDAASALVTRILAGQNLPGSDGLHAAWKTGTSSGSRDAWCAAYTPEYTLCVWMGNKDGSTAEGISGVTHAAPCAGAILQALYRDSLPGVLPQYTDKTYFEYIPLCRKTGLAASPVCQQKFQGATAYGIPLRRCKSCSGTPARAGVRILFPKPGVYQADRTGGVTVTLRADTDDVVWFLDAEYLGASTGKRITLPRGRHVLTAVSTGDGEKPGGKVEVIVE